MALVRAGRPEKWGNGGRLDGSPTLLGRADGALKSQADELPAVIGALHLVTVFVVVSDLRVPGFRAFNSVSLV